MKDFISQFFKIGRWLLLTLCVGFLAIGLTGADVKAAAPEKIVYYGPAQSPILSAIAVPANRAYFWTSGTVPPVLNAAGATGLERYGDTKTQAIGTIQRIESLLKEAGLSLANVTYLRVYLVADPLKNNTVDYQGWFDAYAQFFNTATVPKVARSTLAVAGLVNPDWLIEIEAVAVYPKKRWFN